jgi:hypothetical protein
MFWNLILNNLTNPPDRCQLLLCNGVVFFFFLFPKCVLFVVKYIFWPNWTEWFDISSQCVMLSYSLLNKCNYVSMIKLFEFINLLSEVELLVYFLGFRESFENIFLNKRKLLEYYDSCSYSDIIMWTSLLLYG